MKRRRGKIFFGTIFAAKKMALPSGLEPESPASEARILSIEIRERE